MKKILITGGCGYVGARLVPFLLTKGYDIRVIDSLVFGNALSPFNFELVEGDIRDSDLLEKAMTDVSCIIHLAAISNDPTAELKPETTKSVNYDAIVNMVNVAKKKGVERIILASSSTLYGYSEKDILLSEEYQSKVG